MRQTRPTADRPYRLAMEPDQALAEVREASGSQFDPAVVAAVLAVIDRPSPSTPAPLSESRASAELLLTVPPHA